MLFAWVPREALQREAGRVNSVFLFSPSPYPLPQGERGKNYYKHSSARNNKNYFAQKTDIDFLGNRQVKDFCL